MKVDVFSDLVAELPFILMHPKPEDEPLLPALNSSPSHASDAPDGQRTDPAVENLIQLDG
jgi:hypothetical protein